MYIFSQLKLIKNSFEVINKTIFLALKDEIGLPFSHTELLIDNTFKLKEGLQ